MITICIEKCSCHHWSLSYSAPGNVYLGLSLPASLLRIKQIKIGQSIEFWEWVLCCSCNCWAWSTFQALSKFLKQDSWSTLPMCGVTDVSGSCKILSRLSSSCCLAVNVKISLRLKILIWVKILIGLELTVTTILVFGTWINLPRGLK